MLSALHLNSVKKVSLLILFLGALECSATFQTLHRMRIGSDTLLILSGIPELSHFSSFYEAQRTPEVWSTACYRGYYVIMALKEDSLYLDAIIECVTGKKISLERLAGENPLFADWFSGAIKLGSGEVMGYGFNMEFEELRTLEIKEGIVTKDSTFKNSIAWEKAVRKEEYYRLTSQIAEALEAHLDAILSEYYSCDTNMFPICEEEYFVKVSPKGKVRFVRFYMEWLTPFEERMYGIWYGSCRRKLKRAFKTFDFDAINLPRDEMYFEVFPNCNKEGKVDFFIDALTEEQYLFLKENQKEQYH